jgi:hypothetical protein
VQREKDSERQVGDDDGRMDADEKSKEVRRGMIGQVKKIRQPGWLKGFGLYIGLRFWPRGGSKWNLGVFRLSRRMICLWKKEHAWWTRIISTCYKTVILCLGVDG